MADTSPEFLFPGSALYLAVVCQQFIELVKQRKPGEALEVALKYLSEYRGCFVRIKKSRNEFVSVKISELLGLLCYEEPEHSELAYLLSQRHKDQTIQLIKSFLNRSSCKCCRFWRCFKVK